MKCKVRLAYEVEMIVEAETEDNIQEWLLCTTPQEAKEMALHHVSESYDEEIIDYVNEDTEVDYVIKEEK